MPEIWQKFSPLGVRVLGHVSRKKGHYTPWKPVFGEMWLIGEDYRDKKPMPADYMIYADCCCCKMRADQLVFRAFIDDNPYYDPEREYACAEGFGCKANPRRKIGKAMREAWREVY